MIEASISGVACEAWTQEVLHMLWILQGSSEALETLEPLTQETLGNGRISGKSVCDLVLSAHTCPVRDT